MSGVFPMFCAGITLACCGDEKSVQTVSELTANSSEHNFIRFVTLHCNNNSL